MPENYQIERATVAATGNTKVTILAAPPEGMVYRIFYINGENDSGGTRTLWGVIEEGGVFSWCFQALALDGVTFVTSVPSAALSEWPTIAVLDDTDENFQIYLSDTGTMTISLGYEIVDKFGPRPFRNSFVVTDGTTPVELIPAPTSETVHFVHNVNGLTGAATRTLYLDAGTGSPTNRMAEFSATALNTFRSHLPANQSPFPPITLSGTSDSLYASLNGTGTLNLSAHYEILDRRVVA